jgi:hypothetical protein
MKQAATGAPGGAKVMSGETRDKPLANDAPKHPLDGAHADGRASTWQEDPCAHEGASPDKTMEERDYEGADDRKRLYGGKPR